MAVSAGGVPNVAEQLEGCGQAGSLKRQQPELVAENTTTPKAPKRQKSIPSAEQHDDQNQTPNQDGCQQLQQAVQSVCDEEELPSWCEHPLVLRQHFPDDAQVDAFCYLPGHPLCALAAEGKAALLCKVLEQGGDPDAQDSRGYTALHLACWHAQLACVRVLLEAGASLAVLDRAGRIAQDMAAAAGHADVEAMLQQAAEVRQALLKQQQTVDGQQQQQRQASQCDARVQQHDGVP